MPFHSKITIEEINSRKQLRRIKRRWNNLLAQCDSYTPYFTFEWYYSALETIDKDKEPLLLFFKSSGTDIGFAPLVYKKQTILGFTYHIISFVQNPYTPYQGFIYLNEYKDILINLIVYLRNRFGSLFSLDLNEIRATHVEEKIMKDLAADGLILFHREEKSGSRYLILKENFEHTLNNLNRKTQKEFQRKLKRISKLGVLDLIRIQGKAQIEQHLDYFFKFYAQIWKEEESQPEFYYQLCNRFEKLGALYFYALNLDGLPIAYLICLLGKDTIYGIKTTYDPSYYDFSPGIVLFYKCIEDMFNIPCIREFDIGRGNEQFKREWTSLSHHHTKLLVYPNTIFWQFANRIRYGLLSYLKRYDKFERVYSKVRSHLLDLEDKSIDSSPKPKGQDQLVVDVSNHVGKGFKQSDEPPMSAQEEAESFCRIDPKEIEKMVQVRDEARKTKDWARADAIREELSKKGIILEDGRKGTSWRFSDQQTK
jgi:CelD/BcsL family acetyltransferase involved in cellulose biosynthesis